VEGLLVTKIVTPSGREGWTLVGRDGRPVASVERFLRYRFHTEASPNALRAYAHDLKHFFGFVAEQGLDWRRPTPADLASFTAWLRRPAPNVLPLPGAPPARSEATVSRALSAVFAFYAFHRLEGVEPADRLTTFLGQHRGNYKPFPARHRRRQAARAARPLDRAAPSAPGRLIPSSSRRSLPRRRGCATGCCLGCSGWPGCGSARRSGCATRTCGRGPVSLSSCRGPTTPIARAARARAARSRCVGIAEPLARALLERRERLPDLLIQAIEKRALAHVGHARPGRDREATRHPIRPQDTRHLRDVGPLAPRTSRMSLEPSENS
jgi:hypothetical protein